MPGESSRTPFAVIERSTRIPFAAETVYAWHSRPGALERLTPPWEQIEILERAGGIENGSRTVLRVAIPPLAIRWTAIHRDNVPDRQFVDEQTEGPFAHWVHTHRFTPDGPHSSTLTDRIELTFPFGAVGTAAGLPLVRRRIDRFLAYRHALLPLDLAAHARFASAPRMRVAITGAGGLIGRALMAFLSTGGHRVLRLVRGVPQADEASWDPSKGRLDPSALAGCDAVVHLAGENVAGGRWTRARRDRIRESRRRGTRLIAAAVASLDPRPRVFVSASAIGIYGSRGGEELRESSPTAPSGMFLADVCREWEAATEPAQNAGIRVALPRFGVVLSPAGGALKKMLPFFRSGIGGPVGSGHQWMSWISIDDVIGAIHHALFSEMLDGPINVVGPQPVTNGEFAHTLGHVLGRPSLLPVPALVLRLLYGEMADETVLSSARVLPEKLHATGYEFRHPTLESALRFQLGRFAGL